MITYLFLHPECFSIDANKIKNFSPNWLPSDSIEANELVEKNLSSFAVSSQQLTDINSLFNLSIIKWKAGTRHSINKFTSPKIIILVIRLMWIKSWRSLNSLAHFLINRKNSAYSPLTIPQPSQKISLMTDKKKL